MTRHVVIVVPCIDHRREAVISRRLLPIRYTKHIQSFRAELVHKYFLYGKLKVVVQRCVYAS